MQGLAWPCSGEGQEKTGALGGMWELRVSAWTAHCPSVTTGELCVSVPGKKNILRENECDF